MKLHYLPAHLLQRDDAIIFPSDRDAKDLVKVLGVDPHPDYNPPIVSLVTESFDGDQYIDHVNPLRMFTVARSE